jgi:hypothetical protein
MADDVLGTLANLTLAAWGRRQDGKAKFDQYQQGLIHALEKAGLKSIEHCGWTLKRVPIPMVSCRSCGHALESPEGMPNHRPERIQINRTK